MEISPFIGVENWLFGLDRDQIRSIMGLPFEESILELADVKKSYVDFFEDLNIQMEYDQNLKLNFIEFYDQRHNLIFENIAINKSPYKEVIQYLSQQDGSIEYDVDTFIAHSLGIGGKIPKNDRAPIKHAFVFTSEYYKAPTEEDTQSIIDYYLKIART